MFIKEVKIKNFRLFKNLFTIADFNIPDSTNEGSGLNIFVGENGCGKTALLDAITLPLLEYKAETVDINDFYSIDNKIEIKIFAKEDFKYDGTMPRVTYEGKGFEFEAGIRSRENTAYLSSSIVSDSRFIRADGKAKPEDGKPDLRTKVDNPWKGSRFTENDILYLDRNRIFQIRSGTYNTTRFDRLMEDFNYKHVKNNSPIEDLDGELVSKVLSSNHDYLKKACEKFKELSGQSVDINLLNNLRPFRNGFFGVKRDNNHQVPISDLGSGYEMIFTFLYSYYLSQQSGKKLILVIDEPELHLHPKLQKELATLLIELSKDAQIFIATHSPLFVKQIMINKNGLIKTLIRNGDDVKECDPQDTKLSYPSSNEVNYIAFQIPTEEYHNELYEELYINNAMRRGIKKFDVDYFQGTKSESATYEWEGSPNEVSLHTYVRNQIHHRAECGTAEMEDIKNSIEKMRSYL